jgi:cyclic beta-1,2-glucan synthetase
MLGKGTRAFELYSLINPIRHSETPEEAELYKVEPYVVCADVYGAPPHTGRGGWTWYTGSASWMYRVGLEAILGLQLHGDHFRIDPCIPAEWPGFEMTLRRDGTVYRVKVENPSDVERGVKEVLFDGKTAPDGAIPFRQDGSEHEVRVVLG